MTIRITPGGAQDATAMVQTMQAAFDARFGEAWTSGQLLGALSMPDTVATLARHADALDIIGFTLVRRVLTQAELLLIAVTPLHRRNGLGRQLVEAAANAATTMGVEEIFLEVRDGNISAINLYQSAAFAMVGRRRDYYAGSGGERFDAITMRRNLRN